MTLGSVRSGLGFVLAGLLLASCSNSPSSSGDLANAGGTPPTVAGVPASVVLSSTGNSLGPSSSTIITATVMDDAGTPVANATVTFSIVTGTTLGTLSPTSSATNSSGIATTTFTTGATQGLVQIQGTVPVQSSTIQSGVVLLSISNIGSIQLVGAVPTVIGLQGSGQAQSSTVTIKVLDQLTNPVPDTTSVAFSISGPGGGETFFPAVTNTANGLASVIIRSGTKAGPVNLTVTATLGSTLISNTFTPVSIGGGIPDQGHLSLGAKPRNLGTGAPGIGYLDVTTTLECKMADMFGSTNILEGTSASFYTEAGAVEASDVTFGETQAHGGFVDTIISTGGIAAVILRTQNPPPDVVNLTAGRHPENGRVTVLCETGGQEHFEDNNSNGVFDSGDTFTAAQDDITEPFLDRNENGTWDPGEYFDDVNHNGIWDAGNGIWDANTKIWKSDLVVFSGPPVNIELAQETPTSGEICVSDLNGNAIMGGSTIQLFPPLSPPGALVTLPGIEGVITIPDMVFPQFNSIIGKYAGTCYPFTSNTPGITFYVAVTWIVPGFDSLIYTPPLTLQ
jgi:adhesin/invasin